MIRFENVTLYSTQKKAIVENVCFEVNPGEKCVLTGPSGCGKSTILRSVPAGIEYWNGAVSIDSTEVSPHSIHGIRGKVGYIPQEPRLPECTVEEYLQQFTGAAKLPWSSALRSKAVDLLKNVNLSEKTLGQDSRRLSGGERQRVAIIAVLLLERTIILADEITSALDAKSKDAVMNLIFDSECTLLSVSHEQPWVERCDCSIDVSAFRGGDNV